MARTHGRKLATMGATALAAAAIAVAGVHGGDGLGRSGGLRQARGGGGSPPRRR